MVRLTDRPDMTLDVYRGRKPTMQQQQQPTGCNNNISELQVRGDTEDNSKIIFLFLNENICCDPSLEPSR